MWMEGIGGGRWRLEGVRTHCTGAVCKSASRFIENTIVKDSLTHTHTHDAVEERREKGTLLLPRHNVCTLECL